MAVYLLPGGAYVASASGVFALAAAGLFYDNTSVPPPPPGASGLPRAMRLAQAEDDDWFPQARRRFAAPQALVAGPLSAFRWRGPEFPPEPGFRPPSPRRFAPVYAAPVVTADDVVISIIW